MGVFPLLVLAFLGAENDESVSYFRDIWPILQRECQGCHQPAVREGKLDLTSYDAFRQGGEGGPAFEPGYPDLSLVVAYLSGQLEPRMPQKRPPLAEEQIELFRRWIAAGAEDDTPAEFREFVDLTEPPLYHLPPVTTALAYSPDGNLLAVSGYREVLLHRSDGSGLEARLLGLSSRIQSLVFSGDGSLLVAAGGTPARFGEIQIWDVPRRKLKQSITACTDTVFGASLSPDGSLVAVGCSDHTVRLVSVESGEEISRLAHHENWVLDTCFDTAGRRLVSVGRDRAAKLVEVSSGAFLENISPLRGELAVVARHPRRDAVVMGGEDRVPYYYLMERPRKMRVGDDATFIREFERQQGEIFALAFSPDGSRLAVAGASLEIPLYDVESGQRLATCRGHEAGIYTLAFHPSGRELAAGGFDGRIRIYAVETGELLREFVPVPLQEPVSRLSSSGRKGGG